MTALTRLRVRSSRTGDCAGPPPAAAGAVCIAMRVRVGCSGWFYSHWRGVFYPPQEPSTKLWFGYYANVFDTVELNAPFYRWPSAATVRRWRREAPPGFVYSVKVNQRITHERRMVRTRRLIQDYYAITDVLGEKMGCFLFQFPPSYRYTPSRLKSIVTQLDPAQRNVVEFRHRSWWRPTVYRALAERNISFCAVSAPRLPETFPLPQPRLYVRFSGRTQWYREAGGGLVGRAMIIRARNLPRGSNGFAPRRPRKSGFISTTTAKVTRSRTR